MLKIAMNLGTDFAPESIEKYAFLKQSQYLCLRKNNLSSCKGQHKQNSAKSKHNGIS
jgi:hypothetical protein